MNLVLFSLCALHFLLNLISVSCERQDINALLYEKFDKAASCFRLLNGTHQFGCSSSVSGSLGVIHFIQNEHDIDWLINNAKAGPYMAVVPPKIFNQRNLMLEIQSSKDISGILLAINGSSDRPEYFSPDDTCPNRYSGEGTCSEAWNPEGTSLLLVDWGKPMFVVKDPVVISKMHECFLKFNQPFDDSQIHKSLCSLQMKSHMHAAVDTPTCIRRSNSITFVFNPLSYCDGMGDKNIISTLEPIKKPDNRSILLFSTRLDTASMFDGVMLGAMSTMTGLVTFLATAKLLSSMLPANSSYERNVMFAMFNGEMYDYIGSGRTVYDITQNTFPKTSNPIGFEHIGLMVDVSQLSKSTQLYCHTKKMNNDVDLLTKDFCRSLETNAVKPVTVSAEVDEELPPSSVHPFLKKDKNIPAVVLANHAKQFINRYYNGLMDNASNIDYRYYNSSDIPEGSVQDALAKISTSLARSLYEWVTKKRYSGSEVVKPDIIDELLHCYLESRNCKIFKDANAPEEKLTADLTPLYVGVYKSVNPITKLTALTHVYFTGRDVNISESNCKSSDDDYSYYWISGQSGKGECKQTTVQLLKALSPAFEIDGYDWTSREYSTWSESVWQEMSLRMFLKPSGQQEMVTLIIGLVTLVLSFVTVYWLKSQAHLLFQIEVGVAC